MQVTLDENTAGHFMLGDIVTLDSAPWEFCTRQVLRDALERLHNLSDARLFSAFEHEFQTKGAGLSPDSLMKEYGSNQFEVVIAPAIRAKSADHAVVLRELTRSSAKHLGETTSFTPTLNVASVGTACTST